MSIKYTILICAIFISRLSFGQSILDSCLRSVPVLTAVNFPSSSIIANVHSSDVIEWDGTNWLGGYPAANITIAPPTNLFGCRAFFVGNSGSWTTGGETFGFKLSEPLVSGQTYTFNFTYVSHGLGADGDFSPFIFTNSSPNIGGAAFLLGNLPSVGFKWTRNTFSFTAQASQTGHTWVAIGTQPNGSSGLVSAFCDECGDPCHGKSINLNLGGDTIICEGQNIILDATVPDATYLWQDNSSNPTFNVTEEGTYWVQVTVDNCILTDTISFIQEVCEVTFEMPNVFTPNNDGINDLLVPIVSTGITSMNTIIFNRWGEKVYETQNPLIEWDGQGVSDGTYFWKVDYTGIDQVKNTLKGYVTILK